MPSTKGFLDNPKTTSYRIDAIQSVRHARKAPQNVKLKVSQDGTHKTYDFEAENETTAGEHCIAESNLGSSDNCHRNHRSTNQIFNQVFTT